MNAATNRFYLYFLITLLIFESRQEIPYDSGCYIPITINYYIPKDDLIIFRDESINITLKKGTYAESDTFIKYVCPNDYFLDGKDKDLSNFCDGFNWIKSHPKCIKMCPPIIGDTIDVICSFKGKGISCDKHVEPGTTAKIYCAVMYQKPQHSFVHEDLLCQTDGNWNYSPFACEQICGTIDRKIAFSVKSRITEIRNVPWQVAIYYFENKTEKYEHICGGTIITPKFVISAAHCFWDMTTSQLNNATNYIAAVGKFYRDYYATNETESVQVSNIEKINTPIQFSGPNYDYLGDIAVLLLKNRIVYKNHIRPACLAWKSFNDRYISSNIPGIIAGWGVTDTGSYSPQLRSLELLSVDGETCRQRIKKNLQDTIANDKFCVDTQLGGNICSGDSGGGFLVPSYVNGTAYYHLWGIVSNGIINKINGVDQCNSNFLTSFLNIQYYKDLVIQSLSNASLVANRDSKCYVPTKPFLTLIDSVTGVVLKSGTFAKLLTSVKYVCNDNALLEGESKTNLCDGEWAAKHPHCKKRCPPIKGYNINALCYYKKRGVSCNGYAKAGTIARLNCAIMYTNSQNQNLYDYLRCEKDGDWSYSKIECNQICGTVNTKRPFNAVTRKSEVYNVPWQARIYIKYDDGNFEPICSGTIIESKIIITSANCFWNLDLLHFNDESSFQVTVGKLYSDYYANNETELVQRFSISKIEPHPQFKQKGNAFYNNIAVVILDDHIVYKNHIRPACLSWENFNEKHIPSGKIGKIASWNTKSFNPELRSFELSSIDGELCKQMIGKIKNKRLLWDKFCVKVSTDTNVSLSDNGSGFVVPENIDGSIYYHLWGITSRSIPLQKYGFATFYTNVQFHESLVAKSANDALLTKVSEKDMGCHVPKIRHLLFKENLTNVILTPGTYVSRLTSVKYACSRGVLLDAEHNSNLCFEDWIKPHPKCVVTCNPIRIEHTRNILCHYKGEEISCNERAKPGTMVKISCVFLYEKPKHRLVYENIRCQRDGEWDYPPFKCEQICGTVDVKLPSGIKNELTEIHKVPWHATIYKINKKGEYVFVCDGVIIRSRVVISAAHCFWDTIAKRLYNASGYIVIVGKFHRDYYARNEALSTQEINISRIDIPIQFAESDNNFISDVAVLLLKNHIVFKNHIRPVCIMWKEHDKFIPNNLLGKAIGWTLNGNNFEFRSIDRLSTEKCKARRFKDGFNIPADNFCTHFSEKNYICHGNSGSGFISLATINGKIHYQLLGVLSSGIKDEFYRNLVGSCSSNVTTFYTNIQFYESLIRNTVDNT